MNVDDLNPVKAAPNCKIPALFIHGRDDNFIKMTHTEENYEAYGGDKNVVYCYGGHNSERSKDVLEEMLAFFKKNLLD